MDQHVDTVLVLKTVNSNMSSHWDSKFFYPRHGVISCPDWDPTSTRGHGLHGLLRGVGNSDFVSWQRSAVWLVIRVATKDIVNLHGAVKFPTGVVVYAGNMKDATDILKKEYPDTAVIGCTHVASDGGKTIAGYKGTARAGDYGSATAGDKGTAIVGNCGIATAGSYGIAFASYDGVATAGFRGQATAQRGGRVSVGESGIASVGEGGIASAGQGGQIHIRWYDHKSRKLRTFVGYVGEDGICPDVYYRIENGKPRRVKIPTKKV
jgi:hypothetical protein